MAGDREDGAISKLQLAIQYLILWTTINIIIGAILTISLDFFWKGFGLQALIWGLITLILAMIYLKKLHKNKIKDYQLEDKLSANIWIFLVFLTIGLILLFIPAPFWRGTSLGLIFQALAMFFLEGYYLYKFYLKYLFTW